MTKLLLEENEKFFGKFVYSLQHGFLPSKQEMTMLQQSIVMQALFDPTAFFDGPSWLRILSRMGRVPGLLPSDIDYTSLQKFIEREYLTGNEIHGFLCNGRTFNKLVILQPNNETIKVLLFLFYNHLMVG